MYRNSFFQPTIIGALLLVFTACKFRQKADLLVHHAKIYTVNGQFDTAQAMAIRDGKIIAIGTNDELLKQYESDSTVDAKGRCIYPGFIDAHAHFYNYGLTLNTVDLTGAQSWQECLQRIRLFVADKKPAPGQWITGRGWDQNDWAVKEFPDRAGLDSLLPNHPALFTRVDGHAAIANGVAMALAKLQPGQTLVGGQVETANNRLTGILIDNAVDLVSAVIPPSNREQETAGLLAAQRNCFAVGLTTVVDCGLLKSHIETIDALQKEGPLKMRLNAMLTDSSVNYDHYLKAGPYKTERLHVSAFKLYADGALGSRGACLLHGYADKPGWFGFLLKDKNYYRQMAEKLYAAGFQMCTHAIGDSANREILGIYADILKGPNDRRWRIEHAQVVAPEDFAFFGKYSIIPSVQPTHATSDMYWAGQRLGPEVVKGAYAWQQLLSQNKWIPLGTDFPVEDISPFKTFFAAVVRQDAKGYPPGGFQTDNGLGRRETLQGMTIWAAKGSFEEKEKGSLETGKYADFIMLDKDLMTCPTGEILQTKVLATYVGGERVFGMR
jgi:predicted amidohydrolase YtcJ